MTNTISGDKLLHYSLMGGQARVLFCETTQAVQDAANIHNATPVCIAALGRLLSAAVMMGAMAKSEEETVSITINGDGPMGQLVAVANRCKVRVCAENPQVELPLRESDGKLDVSGAVGTHGRMSVVKDLGLREPYIGHCELVSGELGMDFANYFTVSEQQPSLVALGVLVHGDSVIKAGGLLIQPLPGCEESTLDQLELRSPMFADLSREMTFASPEQLAEDWFRGLEPELLETEPVAYKCNCSRERMERALLTLNRADLQSIIDDNEGAELGCHFCHSKYFFTTEELKQMMNR